MALALKEELHRLVDEIPSDDPRVMRAVFEALLRVLDERPYPDDPLLRTLRQVVEEYLLEVAESEVEADVQATEPLSHSASNQRQAAHSLPRVLAEAPADDEPLTPEEIEMLDARIQALVTTPAIPHEEVLRRLRS